MNVQTIQKNLQQKIGEHVPCGCSMSTIRAFDQIENKYSLYREENCMKKFCSSLREHARNVISFGENMLPLTKRS